MAGTATNVDQWFLTAEERGNPATSLDARHGPGTAWTNDNAVTPLVHGRSYFVRLQQELKRLRPGDQVLFTDWRGDPDEQLDGPGTEVGSLLKGLSSDGVDVRGLVWRSHPDEARFSEQEAMRLGEMVNEAGGRVLLDERVRPAGSHHQKLVVLRFRSHPERDVAFVGGIDLCHGRGDDERHTGDPQPFPLTERYGPRPPWHDVQLEIRGPAVSDLASTFRERWEDPTPLDHRNPWRALIARMAREPRRAEPLPEWDEGPLGEPPASGPHAVQILRTYPAKRPPYPFAPEGERSIARGYHKAFGRARRLIYIEDQYLWSSEIADVFVQALRRAPDLRVIVVVPRYPEVDGAFTGPPNRYGQHSAIRRIRREDPHRVAIYDLTSEGDTPIYVHAKVCVIDDVWATVGSDNLNRRSWTHDSELSCAVLDRTPDERQPTDPGGHGDGARRFARELRLALWREHLGLEDESRMLDPVEGFDLWRESAGALDAWYRQGREGPRPPGRARPHTPDRVGRVSRVWAGPTYRWFIDPDGRPLRLRRAGRF
jgi:phosphatidylserine/phosphatidylglycerophosphate/cardiolipin synthase-like enzyme